MEDRTRKSVPCRPRAPSGARSGWPALVAGCAALFALDCAKGRSGAADSGGGSDAGPSAIVAPAMLQGLFTSDAGPATTLFVSPSGVGSSCTQDSPCALTTAQNQVRSLSAAMAGDLLVYLRGGTYALSTPWTFAPSDSGQNGHRILYAAFPGEGPVVSGGVRIPAAAWQRVDPATQHYQAQLPVGTSLRNLYLAGARVPRAHTGDLQLTLATEPTYVFDAVGDAGAYWTNDPSIALWTRPELGELVAFDHWEMYRCPIASIVSADGGSLITLAPDCWNATGLGTPPLLPEWIENVPETLTEGTFAFDPETGRLDYLASPGPPPADGGAEYSALEQLLTIAGTPDAPVHDLGFEGLSFVESGWTQASTPQGYVGLQAGLDLRTGLPPAAIDVECGRRLFFFGNQLRHLGGMGIRLGASAQDNQILGNDLEDISSVAVEVGDFSLTEVHAPPDAGSALKVSGNLVQDNFIAAAGAEYFDAVGILVGYTDRTTLAHNDLFGLPYTGISVGWGWGLADVGNDAGTSGALVVDNVVAYPMRQLFDGAAAYFLGAQPGTVVAGNDLHGQGAPYGSLYLDNGSNGETVSGNAICDDPCWLFVQDVAPPFAQNCTVTGNFTCASTICAGANIDPSNAISGTVVDPGGFASDTAARSVVAAAGLDPAYAFMHPPNRAAGQSASASSVWDGGGDYGPSLANDETATTGWSPTANDSSPWWQVDLGQPYAIARIEILARMGTCGTPSPCPGVDQPQTRRNFAVLASNDPTFATFTTLATQGATPFVNQGVWSVETPTPVTARYVRVQKTAAEYFFLSEVRVLAP